jgi:3-hydroxy-9,10-secoandrosta-1,3,5(10)-triene-9,17-dione monooxygenase
MAELRDGTGAGRVVNPGPAYQVPMVCAFPSSLVATALGVAQGAYAHWRDWTRERVAMSTGAQIARQSGAQMRLGRAAGDLAAAELLMRSNIALIDAGTQASLPERARMRLHWGHALALVVRAVDELFQAGGARGLVDANPLQRAWRDVHAIASHAGLNHDAITELFGRRELGLEPNPADPAF